MPMNIWMKFKPSVYGGVEQELENITEIHFNFKEMAVRPDRIAFESDIEGTGNVYDLSDIDEFEAVDVFNDVEERRPILDARNELIDCIDDINDFIRKSSMKDSVVSRLSNALDLLNEFLTKHGIDEDYVSGE